MPVRVLASTMFCLVAVSALAQPAPAPIRAPAPPIARPAPGLPAAASTAPAVTAPGAAPTSSAPASGPVNPFKPRDGSGAPPRPVATAALPVAAPVVLPPPAPPPPNKIRDKGKRIGTINGVAIYKLDEQYYFEPPSSTPAK